jgi:hypothetical protein
MWCRHAERVQDGGKSLRTLRQLGETMRHEAISNDQTQRNRRSAGECRSRSYFFGTKISRSTNCTPNTKHLSFAMIAVGVIQQRRESTCHQQPGTSGATSKVKHMFSRGTKFAILAIFGILAVFMFHAASGPFSVVHGPATAFRALRNAVLIMFAMMVFALGSVRRFATFLAPRRTSWDEPCHAGAADHFSVLLR